MIQQSELTVFLFMTSNDTCFIGFFQLKDIHSQVEKSLLLKYCVKSETESQQMKMHRHPVC